MNDGVGKGRSGGSLGNDQGRDPVRRQDFRGHRAERFPEKARIASHDHPRALRLLRGDIAGDPAYGAPHVGECEFFRHHCPPTRCPKLDLR